jgi:curved DNA-binding protein CbpA
LAARWHPEKHPNDRLNAQNRFNQINEAYLVLSDPAQKHHYDIMKRRQFTMSDAEKIFEKFFEEFGIKEEKEKEFFSKNYPARKPSYYEVLGVPKTASFADLQKAYRKLAVKYHPSANHGDAEAEKKFIEINEAYSHLCNVFRRRNYDDIRFGSEVAPTNAHHIFVDFFRTNPELFEDDVELFTELLGARKDQHHHKDKHQLKNVDELAKDSEFAESFKSQTIYSEGASGPVGRTISQKKSIKNGKKFEVTTDEILRPNGSKHVTETINEDGKTQINKYELAPGQHRKEIKAQDPAQIKS